MTRYGKYDDAEETNNDDEFLQTLNSTPVAIDTSRIGSENPPLDSKGTKGSKHAIIEHLERFQESCGARRPGDSGSANEAKGYSKRRKGDTSLPPLWI